MSGLSWARGLNCPAACGILVPQPGIEPMSPALEGGVLTTGPPGKSQYLGFEHGLLLGDKVVFPQSWMPSPDL